MRRADRAVAAPWSGQAGWHVAHWGSLGWAETAVKGLALTPVIIEAVARPVASDAGLGWSVPSDHRLPFWMIVLVAAGYVGTLVDRVVDREIISLVFVIVTLIGYWSVVWLAGLPPWPASLIRWFAVLVAVGEVLKVAYFVTTGARVRRLPRSLPIAMTSMSAGVHIAIAAAA